MPILIDGNNLLHTLPAKSRDRNGVRRLVLDQTRFERISVTVVFDGSPPQGVNKRESLGAVTIVYAGGASADDVIINSLPHGKAAKAWTVVTDDRELSRRASQRGAAVRPLRSWKTRKKNRPQIGKPRPEAPLSASEVTEWQRFFEGDN